MEITEAHIKIAKREIRKGKSTPGVAGTLMNHTTESAEFSDLIAIANRAKMQLKKEQEKENEDAAENHSIPNHEGSPNNTAESDTQTPSEPDTTSSTDSRADFGDDAMFETQVITTAGSAENETVPNNTEETNTTNSNSDSDVPDIDEINDPASEPGASSWQG